MKKILIQREYKVLRVEVYEVEVEDSFDSTSVDASVEAWQAAHQLQNFDDHIVEGRRVAVRTEYLDNDDLFWWVKSERNLTEKAAEL